MGPLNGLRVIEMAGIGPGPFAAMMMADMGADVIRIDRAEAVGYAQERDPRFEVLNRGRRSVALDLKRREAVAAVLDLVERADVLIEGYRPGVMERLGLGPDVCAARNRGLVYGRMTGWGQTGPLAHAAGHDVNYIALSGALYAIGRAGGPPIPPLNLVGDFGGGSMYLLFGIMSALFERQKSGLGQVVDAAILDGAVSLIGLMLGAAQRGGWSLERGSNHIDGGRPWYDTYECADGQYISVGALEPKFFDELVQKSGLGADGFPDRTHPDNWPELRTRFEKVFRSKTRDEWAATLEGTDACFAPVLDMMEAMAHPQNLARTNHVDVDGVHQPAPAPRFSRTAPSVPRAASRTGADTRAALMDWGLAGGVVEDLLGMGIAVQRDEP